jgi:hypothetical protein
MNENHTHTTTNSTLKQIMESFNEPGDNTPFVEPPEFIPEEELIAAGVYNLDQNDWIKLLELVNKSDMPHKQRDRLQYKLAIMLYQRYVD